VVTLEVRVASNEIACTKPGLGDYLAFEQAASVTPTEIVFFDDSSTNIQAAIARDWRAFQGTDLEVPSQQMRRWLTELGVLSA
jgi:HAD superfamily hydrolase (TIGR01509 family)